MPLWGASDQATDSFMRLSAVLEVAENIFINPPLSWNFLSDGLHEPCPIEELAEYFAMVRKVIAGFLASLEINIFNYSLSADGRGDIKYFTG